MSGSGAAAKKAAHPWSSEALLAKAQRYAEEMQSHSRDEWQFGLLSTFVLEFLARAALAKTSPTLLADSKEWNNVYYALGYAPTAPKFIPKSIDSKAVFSRLREIYPSFTTEHEGFAAQHMVRRNEELHAGGVPFDGVSPSWLGAYYDTSKVLLAILGEPLDALFGTDEAKLAESLITARQDESAKSVMQSIHAHTEKWQKLDGDEQAKASVQATAWATRQHGHRISCPSCGNTALVVGPAISSPIRKLDGDLIVEVQEHIPSRFECVACGLKIAGLSQLTAGGLASTHKATSVYDAAEYYAPQDPYAGFEDDNNEY